MMEKQKITLKNDFHNTSINVLGEKKQKRPIAWKLQDPTEGARPVYDQWDLEEIEAQDAGLILTKDQIKERIDHLWVEFHWLEDKTDPSPYISERMVDIEQEVRDLESQLGVFR